MTAGDVDMTAFQSSGIDVTSIVDFVKSFIGKNVAPQPIAQKLGTTFILIIIILIHKVLLQCQNPHETRAQSQVKTKSFGKLYPFQIPSCQQVEGSKHLMELYFLNVPCR